MPTLIPSGNFKIQYQVHIDYHLYNWKLNQNEYNKNLQSLNISQPNIVIRKPRGKYTIIKVSARIADGNSTWILFQAKLQKQ